MSFSDRVLGFGAFPNRDTTYEIDQSLMFNGSSSYLHLTPSGAGDRDKWTFSCWVKRGNLSISAETALFGAYDDANNRDVLRFKSSDELELQVLSGGTSYNKKSDAKYRDPSAWYHIVAVYDSANATADYRIRLYVNGSEITSSTGTDPASGTDSTINNSDKHYIGARSSDGNPSLYWNGYMAEVHFIDGSALTPSAFGETHEDTGQWIPKKYSTASGAYDTNGFYLKFVSGALGTDSSGEGNNYTAVSLDNDDVFLDSPTNNFSVANPLAGSTDIDWYQGNTVPYQPSQSNFGVTVSTIAVESGKYYAEFRVRGDKSNAQYIGAGTYVPIVDNSNQNGNGSGNVVLFPQNSTAANRAIVVDGTAITTDLTAGSEGDKYGVALDADNAKVYFYRNGSTIGSTSGYSITDVGTGKYHFIIGVRGTTDYRGYWEANFGANSSFAGNETKQNNGGEGEDFYYTPPTDYKALCTANLPTPTITKGTDHFNTILYTGNDTDDRTLTGVGFQPDWVWIKTRNATNYHNLFDAVRGVSRVLYSNNNLAEVVTSDPNNSLVAFTSDGFTVDDSSEYNDLNSSSHTYVAWNWKANGSGSADTSADIDATVSANTAAGFSIVTWTANGSNTDTIPHGLGTTPKVVLYKQRATAASSWYWWTTAVDGSQDYLILNTTAAKADINTSTYGSLTSSTFTNFGYPDTNTMVAYCFAEVDGYSKFGSYEANNSTAGPFIFTGFTPAWLMIKYADGAGESWWMYDNKRNAAFNLNDDVLYANLTAVESSSGGVDFLSNGFKLRATSGGLNSANTYSYMVFGSSPFKYSNAR